MLMAGRPSMPGTRHNSRDASGRRTLDGALQGSSAIARSRTARDGAPDRLPRRSERTRASVPAMVPSERRRGGDADERAACRRCTPRRHRHSARRTPQPAAPLMQPRAASASNGSGDSEIRAGIALRSEHDREAHASSRLARSEPKPMARSRAETSQRRAHRGLPASATPMAWRLDSWFDRRVRVLGRWQIRAPTTGGAPWVESC